MPTASGMVPHCKSRGSRPHIFLHHGEHKTAFKGQRLYKNATLKDFRIGCRYHQVCSGGYIMVECCCSSSRLLHSQDSQFHFLQKWLGDGSESK